MTQQTADRMSDAALEDILDKCDGGWELDEAEATVLRAHIRALRLPAAPAGDVGEWGDWARQLAEKLHLEVDFFDGMNRISVMESYIRAAILSRLPAPPPASPEVVDGNNWAILLATELSTIVDPSQKRWIERATPVIRRDLARLSTPDVDQVAQAIYERDPDKHLTWDQLKVRNPSYHADCMEAARAAIEPLRAMGGKA